MAFGKQSHPASTSRLRRSPVPLHLGESTPINVVLKIVPDVSGVAARLREVFGPILDLDSQLQRAVQAIHDSRNLIDVAVIAAAGAHFDVVARVRPGQRNQGSAHVSPLSIFSDPRHLQYPFFRLVDRFTIRRFDLALLPPLLRGFL